LKLRDLTGELSDRVFEFALARCRRLPNRRRSPAVLVDPGAQRDTSRLKLGDANRSDCGRRQVLDHSQFLLPEPALVEHSDQADRARDASQRIKRVRIGTLTWAAALQTKQLVTGSLRIAEVSNPSASDQRRGENRERYSRILALYYCAASGNQVHAHLPVRARVGKRAAITDVAALDDPYLASRRADVGSELVGNQA